MSSPIVSRELNVEELVILSSCGDKRKAILS
jgi:hypothetical protein